MRFPFIVTNARQPRIVVVCHHSIVFLYFSENYYSNSSPPSTNCNRPFSHSKYLFLHLSLTSPHQMNVDIEECSPKQHERTHHRSSPLEAARLFLEHGAARPFEANNSRYTLARFFLELASSGPYHKGHGSALWLQLLKVFIEYETDPDAAIRDVMLGLGRAVRDSCSSGSQAGPGRRPTYITAGAVRRLKEFAGALMTDGHFAKIGEAAFRDAAQRGIVANLDRLHAIGVNINCSDPVTGRTALQESILAGQIGAYGLEIFYLSNFTPPFITREDRIHVLTENLSRLWGLAGGRGMVMQIGIEQNLHAQRCSGLFGTR